MPHEFSGKIILASVRTDKHELICKVTGTRIRKNGCTQRGSKPRPRDNRSHAVPIRYVSTIVDRNAIGQKEAEDDERMEWCEWIVVLDYADTKFVASRTALTNSVETGWLVRGSTLTNSIDADSPEDISGTLRRRCALSPENSWNWKLQITHSSKIFKTKFSGKRATRCFA